MKIKEIKEGIGGATYKVVKSGPEGTTLQSPDMHTMLTLDPEASKGIVKNPQNPNQFTLNPQTAMGSSEQGQAPQGPAMGSEVEIPANEGQGGHYDMHGEIYNPAYSAWEQGEGDENNPPPETIKVGINYSISGEHRPETWGYHGGEPAETPELDDWSVYNLETGEDISNQIDSDEVSDLIWADAESKKENDFDEPDYGFDETVGGDPTDEFIDDIRDKEFEKFNKNESIELDHIRRLSGL